MDRIPPERLDLAREFKARPFGPHSRDLQKVLSIMRWLPEEGKPVAVCTGAPGGWRVGELSAHRGRPVKVLAEPVLATRDDAFWEVFRRRWQLLTGVRLELE